MHLPAPAAGWVAAVPVRCLVCDLLTAGRSRYPVRPDVHVATRQRELD